MSQATREASRNPFAIGWEAVRANLAPALILQALMFALLLAYFFSPTVGDLFNRLAEMKSAYGIAFVIPATVLAASVLPEMFLVLFFQHGRVEAKNFRNLLFTAPLWAFDGVLVDLMYRGLAALLGDTTSVPVVLGKICIDQFGYNVFFAAPYGVIAYQWKNSGFSHVVLRDSLTPKFYREKIVPTLCTTWALWIPLMAMIYSLPLGLQFPIFSLVLSFWVLILTYMTNRFAGDREQPSLIPVGGAADANQ
jgi:hypothetical protein